MGASEVQKVANMPRPIVNHAIRGMNVRPETIGKVTKAL